MNNIEALDQCRQEFDWRRISQWTGPQGEIRSSIAMRERHAPPRPIIYAYTRTDERGTIVNVTGRDYHSNYATIVLRAAAYLLIREIEPVGEIAGFEDIEPDIVTLCTPGIHDLPKSEYATGLHHTVTRMSPREYLGQRDHIITPWRVWSGECKHGFPQWHEIGTPAPPHPVPCKCTEAPLV